MDHYNHLASQTLWQIEHWDSAPDDVSVVRVNTIEPWGINRSYTLAVDCYTDEPAQKDWLGSRGSLALAGLQLPFVVKSASTLSEPVVAHQPYHVQLILVAPFWLWHMSRHRRHWVNTTSQQIIRQALQSHGMNQHLRWLGDWQRAWPYWLQYYQTDWDCFQQMMAMNAGCFLMPPADSNAPWVLNCAQRLDQLRDNPRHWQLPWQPNGGLLAKQIGVYETSAHQDSIPSWVGVASAQANDTQLTQGDVVWSQVSGAYSHQSKVAYWPWLPDGVSLQQLAKQYAQVYQAQLKQQYWRTQAVDIVPGDTIELVDSDEHPITGTYRIIAVSWHADQSSALDHLRATSGHDPVTTQLTVLPVEYSLPCALPSKPPTLPMTERAWVQSGPDQNGCYQLQDRQAQQGFQTLPSMPLSGFHTGYKSGQHFPLQAGTQVALLTHHQGPAPWQILGCLPQPSQPSPITQEQSGQHLFRTPGGHRWHYNDKAKQYRFDWQHLSEKQGWHWFYDQQNDTDYPALQQWYNHQGPLSVQLGRSSSQTIQGCLRHQANKAYHQSIAGQTHQQYDQNVHIQTKHYRFRNDGNAHIHTPQLNIHSDGPAHLTSHGDMTLKADKLQGKIGGALWLQSHHTLSLQGNITLKAGSSSCQIQGGSIKVSGQNATLIGHGSGGGGGGDSQSPDPQALSPRKPQHPYHWQLQTAKVQPRWRLAWPGEQLTDLASLVRLPNDLQHNIVTSILKRLTPSQSDQTVEIPDSDQWTDWVEPDQASTLQQQLQDKLSLDNAPHLNPGFVYVFIQSPQGPRFQQQPYLWQEYAISQPDEDGQVNFTPVKFEHYAGLDERQATGEAQTYIELPYQYRKHVQKHPVQVWVFYSATQLSWPRIQHYGGMDPDDPRPDQISDADQRQRLQTIQQQSTHPDALKQRAGQSPTIPQQALKGIAHAQQKPHVTPPHDEPGAQAQSWCQTYAHYPDPANNKVPYLLIDDPLGYIERGNQLLVNLWRLLKGQMHQIKHTALSVTDQDGQTHQHTYPLAAILAWQLTYGLKAPGVVEANGELYALERLANHQLSDQPLPWPQAKAQLSQQKLQYALRHAQREGLHQLIHRLQTINTQHLLVSWSVQQQKTQTLPHERFNDPLYAIQDAFAQPAHGFSQGYLVLQGLIGVNASSSRCVDQKLQPAKHTGSEKMLIEFHSYYNKNRNHLELYQPLQQGLWAHIKHDITASQIGHGMGSNVINLDQASQGCTVELLYDQQAPGLSIIQLIHQPGSPLYHCFWPDDQTMDQTSDMDNPAYFKGQGHFNATGFKLAWGDVGEPTEAKAAIAEPSNDLFRSIMSRFVDQSLSAPSHDYNPKKPLDQETFHSHHQQRKNRFHQLLKQATGIDYQQQVQQFRHGAWHTDELKPYQPTDTHGNNQVPHDPAPNRASGHFQHWLHLSIQASGLITVSLTLWDLIEEQLQQQDPRQQPPLLISAGIGLTQLGGTLGSLHEGLGALLGEDAVDHWINQSAFDSFLTNMSHTWSQSSLQVTDLISRWAFLADGVNLAASTLGLINTITGRGLMDTNQLVSQLFETAGHALITGGGAKKLTEQSVKSGVGRHAGEQEESGDQTKTDDTNKQSEPAESDDSIKTKQLNQTTEATAGDEAAEIEEGAEMISSEAEIEAVAAGLGEGIMGSLTPVDIALAIGIACEVVAKVVELFEHNQFQIWAENSVFNPSDTSYTAWVHSPNEQYCSLLQLLVIPHIIPNPHTTMPDSDERAAQFTVRLSSLQGVLSPETIQHVKTIGLGITERADTQANMLSEGQSYTRTMGKNKYPLEYYDYNQVQPSQRVIHYDSYHYPVVETYFGYHDLRNIEGAVLKGHSDQPMFLSMDIHPACQITTNGGSLPSQVPFPGSKGVVDITLDWLDEHMSSSHEAKPVIQLQENHWVGKTIPVRESFNHNQGS